MRLYALRLLMLGVLVGLYVVSATAGVAALACGYGYAFGRRARQARIPLESNS